MRRHVSQIQDDTPERLECMADREPSRGTYSFTGSNLSGGTLWLNNEPMGGLTAFLPIGQSRVETSVPPSGQSPNQAASITIALSGAPTSLPTITGLNSSGVLSRTSEMDATAGYAIRWGTSPGRYTDSVDVSETSRTLRDLLEPGDALLCRDRVGQLIWRRTAGPGVSSLPGDPRPAEQDRTMEHVDQSADCAQHVAV